MSHPPPFEQQLVLLAFMVQSVHAAVPMVLQAVSCAPPTHVPLLQQPPRQGKLGSEQAVLHVPRALHASPDRQSLALLH